MKTLKLKIDGIHCGSCIKVITMGLEELEGIGEIAIDQKTGLANIGFDETKTSEEKILQNIKKSGYEPAVA